MTQTMTLVSTVALAGVVLWWLRERFTPRETLRVSVRLDSSMPGSHLIWNIVNTDAQPVTLTSFAINPRHLGDGRGESIAAVPLATAETLQPGDRIRGDAGPRRQLANAEIKRGSGHFALRDVHS